MSNKKMYIAGKITGYAEFVERFKDAERKQTELGFKVMNPAILPPGFEQEEYMHICYSMIDVCEVVYMLSNWKDSKGAVLEHIYSIENDKTIMYEDK